MIDDDWFFSNQRSPGARVLTQNGTSSAGSPPEKATRLDYIFVLMVLFVSRRILAIRSRAKRLWRVSFQDPYCVLEDEALYGAKASVSMIDTTVLCLSELFTENCPISRLLPLSWPAMPWWYHIYEYDALFDPQSYPISCSAPCHLFVIISSTNNRIRIKSSSDYAECSRNPRLPV
jgi:hypothetical protein